jgi:hypothetical protein
MRRYITIQSKETRSLLKGTTAEVTVMLVGNSKDRKKIDQFVKEFLKRIH